MESFSITCVCVWGGGVGGTGHEHMPPGNILVRIREINRDMAKCRSTHTFISSESPNLRMPGLGASGHKMS